ncbi:MAG: hypothetical protein ACI4IQ_02985 [Eubacterium sp.]
MNNTYVNKNDKSKKKRNKIIIAVTAVVLIIAVVAASIAANETAFKTKMTMLLMPNSLTTVLDDKEITFYVRENKEFNAKTDESQPLSAFEFYYYDDDNNEVNLGSDGAYKTETGKIMPSLLFLLKTNERINKIKSAVPAVIAVAAVIVVAILIVLWYKSWCKRQENEKNRKYKNK